VWVVCRVNWRECGKEQESMDEGDDEVGGEEE
jgi:hypothetical protein